jgi:hypothetical protein
VTTCGAGDTGLNSQRYDVHGLMLNCDSLVEYMILFRKYLAQKWVINRTFQQKDKLSSFHNRCISPRQSCNPFTFRRNMALYCIKDGKAD